jgi:ABC-2 type transport system permease protein
VKAIMSASAIAIAWREFRASFRSPIAYVVLAVFLVAVNWIFFRAFFLVGQADLRVFFDVAPWLFLFFIPAIAMGKWSEERRIGTIETLFTLPLCNRDLVLGKFFAGLLLLAAALALTLPLAASVALVGDLDVGPVIGGYAGLLLLGSAYLAVGLTASALTESQVVAFITGAAGCFVALILGTPFAAGGTAGLATQAMAYLGLGTHFASIARGVLDSRDIIYYASFIGFFLFLNVKALEYRGRR